MNREAAPEAIGQTLAPDPFDDALGPIRPEVTPWRTKRVKPGRHAAFGSLVLTPEGADCMARLRMAAAARGIPLPKAVMLLIRHYLQQHGG